MASVQYHSDSKCYRLMDDVTDNSFNNNFDKYDFTSTYNTFIDECKNKATELKKDFFLISNARKSGNDFKYTCNIPKVSSGCASDNIENLFKPFSDLIDQLLGKKDSSNTRPTGVNITTILDVSENTFGSIDPTQINDDCFEINDRNNDVVYSYAKNNKYTLYESNAIYDNDIFSALANTKDNNYYDNKKTQVFNYDQVVNDLHSKIFNYISDTTSSLTTLENELNIAITNIVNKSNDMTGVIGEIERDIRTINRVSNDYTSYFRYIQETINEKQRKLEELIALDGANNGKLEDTKKMKNMILSETIILILIMVFAIFFNLKKK